MAETLRRGAPRLANVRGLADAGFFLDHANISGAPRIRSEFQYLFAMANVSGSTNAACAAAHARDAPADAWRCFMAQYVLDYVRTPVFLAEGKYDSWQLNNVLQLGCGSPTPETTCDAARLQAFFAYGDAMAAAVGAALAKHPGAGAFFSACIVHCQTVYNEGQDRWHAWRVGGLTPAEAFGNFFFAARAREGRPTRAVDTVAYPGNPSCPVWT